MILALQAAVAVLKLAFGLTAMAVARSRRALSGRPREAWALTAYTFTLGGLLLVSQAFLAIPAVAAGEGSPLYTQFVRFAPAGNYARTLSMVGFAAGLLALSLMRSPTTPRRRLALFAAPVAGAVLGAAFGVAEGPLTAAVHFPRVAVLSTVQLLAFLVALFAALLRGTVDRHLWGALGVYAFHDALNVFWASAFSALDIPESWAPSPAQMQVYGIFIWIIMIAFALWRLRATRHGTDVPPLIQGPTVLPGSLAR